MNAPVCTTASNVSQFVYTNYGLFFPLEHIRSGSRLNLLTCLVILFSVDTFCLVERHRPFLVTEGDTDDSNNYINAAFVDVSAIVLILS